MSDTDEEQEEAKPVDRRPTLRPKPSSSGSSRLSLKSNWSKQSPPDFSAEPGPSHTKRQTLRPQPRSSGSSRLSLKSDWSKQSPPDFSLEPEPSAPKEKKTSDDEEQQQSCCTLCQDVLKDPVRRSCGHQVCRQCSSSHWDQGSSSGVSCCPQCAERSRSRASPRAGLQNVLEEHKNSLRSRCERVTEGSDELGGGTLLNSVYTELLVTEGHSGELQREPELMQTIRPVLQSSESSWLSSDGSKQSLQDLSLDRQPSHTRRQTLRPQPGSSGSSSLSLKSDNLSEPSAPKEKKTSDDEEQQQSCCTLCQDVLKDPVRRSCGHQVCRQCSSSHWDQGSSSGVSCCPQCAERSRSRASPTGAALQKVLEEHKKSLRSRYERVTEGSDELGGITLLNKIYTELYITEGDIKELQRELELMQLETVSRKENLHDTAIRYQDIFRASAEQRRHIRVVLTSGVAGSGKTFSVHKFTLDWAEGLENQDVSVLVVLSFRELNLIRDQHYSLLTLLHVFHPALQKVTAEELNVCRLLFIFDGLDESRLSLDFSSTQLVVDVSHKSSVSLLITNLIRGNLLPSAHVWITSRPAAANQIPPSCVDRWTEMRGFTDAQKEEYFRRRLIDEELSSRIISHIQTSRSLHIMCGIPLFCWITATVLEHMLSTEQRGELPQTLTDMYSHFVLVQTYRKKFKYHEEHETSPRELTEADWEVLLKLGRLAFKHLEKGLIVFYQEDLERCGLDVTEASLHSGICTQIFKRVSVIFQKPVYCFVHISVHQFMAAVYLFHCFTNRKNDVLKTFIGEDWKQMGFLSETFFDKVFKLFRNTDAFPSLDIFLQKVLQKSLRSQNGHLDLFVRFLHGLSLESNQRLLEGLLGRTEISPETIQRVIKNLKKINSDEMSPDRCINIFHCLMEMKDLSVYS